MSNSDINSKPTDQWVKETLAEDYADEMRRRGHLPNSRSVEDIVLADLQTYTNRQREARYRYTDKMRKEKADQAAERLGYKFQRGIDMRRNVAEQKARYTPFQRALISRIRRLISRRDGTSDLNYPRFAREFADEWVRYSTRFTTSGGKYSGLSDKEAESAFSRFCEDLADRSNALPELPDWRKGY